MGEGCPSPQIMTTIAIVGFSDKTLPFLKDSRADEIWTLNHAYIALGQTIPRIDRLFEIHKKDWYLRKEIPKSQAYYEWLQEPHDFPVYMQNVTPEIPASVKYPFDEVCDDIFQNLLRKVGDELIQDTYFTSSAAFMIALAIHELKPGDTIELYGIDMESDTEYGYQKPCGEFMLGMAAGRGIRTIRPEPSEMCRAKLYGYDVVPYVDRNRLAEIHQLYQEESDKRAKELEEYLQKANGKLDDNFFLISAWAYTYTGAMLICEKLMLESDFYISRQIVEMKRASYINNMEYFKGMTNRLRSEFDIAHKDGKGDPAVYGPKWEEYLNNRAEMFGNSGAVQVLTMLMHLIDFRPVEFKLQLDIKEK